ncbi:hypothetical protein [Burkholderia anthina]|uniref:hypothetical protein n=1 Tax=Burkholderia anthina TaxID=179879 RepID=UPI001AA017B4|nr:hypothetical protein [Burkholderia anthina]QTD92776.1 hypothetical protein J4G50_31735 [Burkholderia anthina]
MDLRPRAVPRIDGASFVWSSVGTIDAAPAKKAWKHAFPGLETIDEDGGGDGVVPMRAALLPAASRMFRGQIAQPPR